MTDENKAGAAPEKQEDTTEDEAPRAKTPLERVREGQAKMRGGKSEAGNASSQQHNQAANSYKRRMHQRRAG
jgi:hypothetical protein